MTYPFTLGCRIWRSVARRRGLVDPARSRSAEWRRHAEGRSGSRLGARARPGIPDHRAEGDGDSAAGARPQRARRGHRPAAWARILVSLSRRKRRSVKSAGRKQRLPLTPTVDQLRFAVCGCNHYETGYFTAFRRIADEQFRFRVPQRATTSTKIALTVAGIRHGCPAAQQPGNLHRCRLPESICAIQVGSQSDRGACVGAIRHGVGRSRGRQRLRRQRRRA